MRATSNSSAGNPRRKALTRKQVEAKKEKAVRFLRDVVGEELVPRTDLTGEELADQIDSESVDEYAERKKITMENPLRTDREIIEHVLTTCLPPSAGREERHRAISAAREALEGLPLDASEIDELEAATQAVQAIAGMVKRRCQIESLTTQATFFLPVLHTERDLDEWRHIVTDAVNEMPADASASELNQRIREATAPLARQIKARAQRRSLIDHGRNYVSAYLNELRREGVIDRDEWFDNKLKAHLEQAVSEGLREELSGEEESAEVEEVVRAIVDEELEIEDEDADEESDEEQEEEDS